MFADGTAFYFFNENPSKKNKKIEKSSFIYIYMNLMKN